ncbi:alpha/beta hydrolase [Kitasatospora kazusensis]|uniref:Alpha/beta hydrolase n=1 Tax=Kitasatospora kazusensis TaxID=407974 RepID=A0ABN2Z3R9_9ACTN
MLPSSAALSAVLNTASYLAPGPAGRAAFRVFRLPLARSRPREAEAALMARAEVGRLDVNGESVVTYRWGDGARPVLLVHGWRSRGSRLALFAAGLLERGYSPVAFDAPGHGDSTGRTTTVVEYREAIRLLHDLYGPFEAVVAHSVGVMASFLALRDGVRADRLAAIGGVCEFEYLVDEFCTALRLRPRLRQELRRLIEQRLFPGEPDFWTRFSVVHDPEAVKIPLLVVHDEQDELVGVDQARRIAAAYGDRARLVTTRGLGHQRILAGPEVVAAVLDFVTGSAD